jgi:DNA-binding protein H-NS
LLSFDGDCDAAEAWYSFLYIDLSFPSLFSKRKTRDLRSEGKMKNRNLRAMPVDALIDIRNKIDRLLANKVDIERRELRERLDRLERFDFHRGVGRTTHRVGIPRGSKVPVKFYGPSGETWSGRGLQPRWLSALVKQGRRPEDFAVTNLTAAKEKQARKRSRAR